MNLRPYKFIVQAVVQQTSEDGSVVGEVASEPVTVFGVEGLVEWAEKFPAALQAHVEE